MRIITGIYKGRHFDIPRTFKARPTTDFAKENIFNVLNGYIDFEDCSALDLFSGTGSITLELLSRGCSSVVSVEADKDHHAFIRQCLKKLGTDDCIPLCSGLSRDAAGSSTLSLPTRLMPCPNCHSCPTSSSSTTCSVPMACLCLNMASTTTSRRIPALSNTEAMAASTSPYSGVWQRNKRSCLWLNAPLVS